MPTTNFLDFPLNTNLQPTDYIIGFFNGTPTNPSFPGEFKVNVSSLIALVSSAANRFTVLPTDLAFGAPSWDAFGNLSLYSQGQFVGSQISYIDSQNYTTGISFLNDSISFFTPYTSVINPDVLINKQGNLIVNNSATVNNSVTVNGSLTVNGNIYGTAQNAINANNAVNATIAKNCVGRSALATYADNASVATRALTADYALLSIGQVLSAVRAQFASNALYAETAGTVLGDVPYAANAGNSDTSNFASSSNSSLYAQTADTANTANFAQTANIALSAYYYVGPSGNGFALQPQSSDTVNISYNILTQSLSADINRSYVISTALIFG